MEYSLLTDSDIVVNIREIQHYFYCPHRWGLIHIGSDWSENFFINKAQIIHDNVNCKSSSLLRGKYVERSVQVYNDDWGLFGVLDCLQLTPDNKGYYISKYNNRFSFMIIEYKPSRTTRLQATVADKMQLLAQKICVDSMFDVQCSACLYYSDIRKRVEITFEQNDYNNLKQAIQEIRWYYSHAMVPHIDNSIYCGGCSVKDICLPRVVKSNA